MRWDEALIDQARAQTGLDDFGEDSFREGLAVLTGSLETEADLNELGTTVLRGRIVEHLAQRLQVEDWYRRHPEIDDVEIVAPLIGLGLPRTGSTALSFLLAEDPGVRFVRMWESGQPCPPPCTVDGLDPRIEVAAAMSAGSQSHTPSDPEGPMECLELMALDLRSHIFLAFAQVPSYASWLLDADLVPTFRYQRRVMRLLQWGEPTRPWRLKSPAHSLFLPAIDEVFPDARFVMTHRDPTDVLVSVCEVYADIGALMTDDLDLHAIGRLNVEHWAVGMERVLEFRDRGNEDRFFDIDFRTMQSDPLGEIGRLYDWLGEPVSDEFVAGMQRWWTQNAENREPNTKRPPATFGLDLDAVRPRFADYVDSAERWTGARLGGTR